MIGAAMLPEQLHEFLDQGCNGAELVPLCSETVPGFQLGPEIERLEKEGWSENCIVLDLFEALGASDVKVSPLLHEENQISPQTESQIFPHTALCVTARMPTQKLPGGAASADVTFVFRVCTRQQDASASVTIESAAKAEVPFGNYFVVQEKITMQQELNGVLVTKGFKVAFREAVWVQKVISASAAASQAKATTVLLDLLARKAAGLHDEQVATQIFEVWELQKHNLRSRSGSCLPFLHHRGGFEQQCWLDMDHSSCTLEGGRSPLLPSGVPPVRPPDGWRCKMESWAVVKPPGPADVEGWQYAFSKYKSNIMWGCTSIGRRWQRRLWRCTLVEARKGSSAVVAKDTAGASRSSPGFLVARRPASCMLAAFAVAFVVIFFLALNTTQMQQHAVEDTIRTANFTARIAWAHVLGAAESAGAYIFPLSAFALFCVYPPVLLATMVFEGHAAQEVHTKKPSAANDITAGKMDSLKVL